MNIQEVERKSGLDRANIRFYEKEGLLTPERKANGYRNYSEDDLQLLLKIKLLRQLGFSLDAIRSLKEGSTDLEAAVTRRLEAVGMQRQELGAIERVCVEMKTDGARFHTLDTERYLNAYDSALHGDDLRPAVPETDRVQSATVPWRRFFARGMDLAIAELLLYTLLVFGFGVNIGELPDWMTWLLTFLVWALLLPLEALCIYQWGTTPGKAILGLAVGDENGRPLSFGAAAERTWEVFRYGFGFNIPIYSAYRSWVSYKNLKSGGEPEWDWHITVEARPLRWWRAVVYTAVCLALMGVLLVLSAVPHLPAHQGDNLTVVEFVENYNQLSDIQNKGLNKCTLLSDGTFVRTNAWGELVVDEDVRLVIDHQSGVVNSLSYERTDTASPEFLPDGEGKQVMRLLIRSWAWADADLFSALSTLPVLEELMDHREGTLIRDVLEYRVVYTIRSMGENGEGNKTNYEISFYMRRIN